MPTTKTRYDITLDTAISVDPNEDNNYFDQITALSQGIINASFQQLFESVEGVNEIAFESPLLGRVDAVLDAPSIMINGLVTNATEVMYVLRIKSGTFLFRDDHEIPIHDWVLAIPTKVNELSLDVTGGDSDNAKRRKKRWLGELQENYPGFKPNDYSVQRIFCALGSAGWSKPDDDLSSVWDPVTKTKMTLKAFLSRSDNSLYKDIALNLLQGWATAEGEDAIGTMGIKFKLPETKVQANIPTFRPVYIYNQVYPYLTDENDRGRISLGNYSKAVRTPETPYGILDEGDYNCLVYCENVDRSQGTKTTIIENGVPKEIDNVIARRLPQQLKLSWNGNLAEPGGYYGAFVMDHRVFMSTFLLPQLQELSLATYMQVGEPRRFFDTSNGSAAISPKYAIGCELQGNPRRAASDPFFKLQRVNHTHYTWKSRSEQPGLDKVYSFAKPETPTNYFSHNNYDIWAESSVDVMWEAGSPRLTIEGKIIYNYYTAFSGSQDMKTDPEELHYIYTATWNTAIVLENVEKTTDVDGVSVKTRVLQPVIQKDPATGALFTTSVPKPQGLKSNDNLKDTTKGAIEFQLTEALGRGMDIIVHNIAKRFENSGKFSYPGHGELEFSDPRFTRLGSIIAKVNYKPPSNPDGTMYFPPKAELKPMKPPSAPNPETSTFEAELKHNADPRLTWYTDFKYNSNTRIGRLTMEATNLTGGDLAFGTIYISLEHTPHKDAAGKITEPALFSGSDWKKDHHSIMDQIYSSGKALLKTVESYMVEEPVPEPEQKKTESDQPKPSEAGSVTVGSDQKAPAAEDQKEDTAAVGAALSAPENTGSQQKQSTPETPGSQQEQDPKQQVQPAEKKNGTSAPVKTTEVETPKTENPKTETPKAPRMRFVEKFREISEEQKGNVYDFTRTWETNYDLPITCEGATSEVKTKIATSSLTRGLEFTLLPTPSDTSPGADEVKGFIIPKNKKFTVVMQGEVSELGSYAIKIYESWQKVEKRRIKGDKYATDWKMVELRRDGKGAVVVESWDVSDRLKEKAAEAAVDAAASK